MLLLINAEEWDREKEEYTGNCRWKTYEWGSVPDKGQMVSIGGNGYVVEVVSHELENQIKPHVEVCIKVEQIDFDQYFTLNLDWGDNPQEALQRS